MNIKELQLPIVALFCMFICLSQIAIILFLYRRLTESNTRPEINLCYQRIILSLFFELIPIKNYYFCT